jgi:methionyl-tRNA formyltransferase
VSRTVFLGTSEFAAAVLRRLSRSPHRPALVLTPPARPRGRGRRPLPAPVAATARDLGVEVLEAAEVNDAESLEAIRAVDPEIACVCAFGQLIREPLLSECLMLNLHPSLLPRWRGAAPIERAIMAGDEATGACVIRVEEGLDSGPVALREETAIGADEDYGALAARLAEIGGRLLLQALDLAATGKIEFSEQGSVGVSYAEKISSSERLLAPSRPATTLALVVRALTPHIGAYIEIADGERLGVRRARAEPGDLAPGEIRAATEVALLLGCGKDVLRIEEVQPPGSRSMDVAAYLRGHEPPLRALIP